MFAPLPRRSPPCAARGTRPTRREAREGVTAQVPGRILVVDYQPPNVALIQAQLERAGYSVATAADGPSALALIATDPPDLIILDVMMPGMDGYAVCRQIKGSDATRL